ncbi:hybrid sensor histidine kinase/response regulator [Caulobacter flavus]|uniref:histidine kinase n=2 Tax=Caulobacter flavus TaxID=1679497 RepID=A0A2N5CS76_9CAUL|nr:hybrid sensor histidine kinase/response regulator [Caulobacter flavus]PLR12825.1 hybrid sensor histidine kinase/response regulator [Caulobacter flavus]
MAYSLFLTGAAQEIATIWTANAVIIAGLMTLDRRRGAVLLAVTSVLHLLLSLATSSSSAFALAVTILDGVQIAATAFALRLLRLPGKVRSMRGLLVLTAVSAVFTAATSIAVNGVASLAEGGGFWTGWSGWTTSNVLGVAIALPTILILLDRRHAEAFPVRGWLEPAAGLAAIAAVSWTVFTGPPQMRVLVFAPVLLAAFRGGPRAAALSVMAALAFAIPAVLSIVGLDPRAAAEPMRHLLLFHIVLYAVSMAAALALGRQARLSALLVRRQAAARAAQARAQAANAAKSDFLATISHEIRTPLNSILGFAALVAEDAELSPENRRRLDLVGRAGRSLAEIVSDLLDFAKVEAGRLELVLSPASPAALLRDAAAIIAPEAEAKGLTVSVEVESRPAPLGGQDPEALFSLDETRLRQVLLNLLNNAVKFTTQGGVTARLSIGPDPGLLRFSVADTGIGIAPEVQARLFQRFSQADSSISRAYGGTGLGLAISKALVGQMGGTIWVESALGVGAVFHIALEAQPAQAPEPVEETGPERAAARVLLVDDHPMNRELGDALLTLAGCQVFTAEDGFQAVEAARTGTFDLILMDVHMPGMDGLAAARAIRALDGPMADAPILALSADVLPEQVARCRAAGMDGHVAKPIRRDELLAAVSRALSTPRGRDRTSHDGATHGKSVSP